MRSTFDSSLSPKVPKTNTLNRSSTTMNKSASVLIQRDNKSFSGARNSTSFSFGLTRSSKSIGIQIRPAKTFKESEGFKDLPDTFKVAEKEEFHEEDNCEGGCEVSFKGFRSPARHHCRMCAASVCDNCSTKRRLSKTDPELHYCCNMCDFKITNNLHKE